MAKDINGTDLAVGDRVALHGTVTAISGNVVSVLPHVCTTAEAEKGFADQEAWKKLRDEDRPGPCPRLPSPTVSVDISDARFLEAH